MGSVRFVLRTGYGFGDLWILRLHSRQHRLHAHEWDCAALLREGQLGRNLLFMLKLRAPKAIEKLLRPGQILDRKYRVEKLIGVGGMGAVWAAVNKRTGKPVALKMILQSLMDDERAHERFRREALAAGCINHPNVVSVFDVFTYAGRDCLVMEFLSGETLADRIARTGPLDTEEAFALLLPALRGVAAAHAHQVIHRDLKPHNIFLCVGPEGDYVTTKVVDFGLSKIMGGAGGKDLTAAGRPMGTLAYLPPEIAKGNRTASRRIDVYGFGAILYETFTGHRPFEGLDGIPLLNQIANAAPVPMTSFRPGLDPAIVALVERAMAQNPDQRFRSVEMLIGAIESLLPPTSMLRALTPVVGVPIIPNVVPVRPPSAHPAPRHSRLPWIMAGVATALAIGLACWIAVR